MNELIDKFEDFLADYEIDVYDESQLSEDVYKLDCLMQGNTENMTKAKLRVNRAINDFEEKMKASHKIVLTKPVEQNEKHPDELDFSVTFKLEKKVEDKKVTKDSIGIKGPDYDYELFVISDISGKKDWDGYRIYPDYPDKKYFYDVLEDEVKEEYKKQFHQRPYKDDPNKLTDDWMIQAEDEEDKWYTKEWFDEHFFDDLLRWDGDGFGYVFIDSDNFEDMFAEENQQYTPEEWLNEQSRSYWED